MLQNGTKTKKNIETTSLCFLYITEWRSVAFTRIVGSDNGMIWEYGCPGISRFDLGNSNFPISSIFFSFSVPHPPQKLSIIDIEKPHYNTIFNFIHNFEIIY